MNNGKNELLVGSEVFGGEKAIYCSKVLETVEDRKAFMEAIESADVLLQDVTGQEIILKDVYSEKRMITDEKTGEVRPKYRTILFDADGKTYATGAYGVYSSLKAIFFVHGEPASWGDGLKVKVEEKKLDKGRTSLVLKY